MLIGQNSRDTGRFDYNYEFSETLSDSNPNFVISISSRIHTLSTIILYMVCSATYTEHVLYANVCVCIFSIPDHLVFIDNFFYCDQSCCLISFLKGLCHFS